VLVPAVDELDVAAGHVHQQEVSDAVKEHSRAITACVDSTKNENNMRTRWMRE
jgi:hypothetical protein